MTFELNGAVTLIEVASVSRSIAFYRHALGLDVHQRAGDDGYIGWAWLKRGNVELMLNAMFEPDQNQDEPEPARTAAHRDTTIFIGCPDLDAAYVHLRSSGIDAPAPVVTHYGMRQLSFSDPDGYKICLQWPVR